MNDQFFLKFVFLPYFYCMTNFNRSNAKILSPIVEINGDASREALIARLPVTAVGGTCIGCGLQKALDVSIITYFFLRAKIQI